MESDLRAAADDIAADAARVQEIEIEKRDLPPEHPRTSELARESEALTSAMADKARLERALVEVARDGAA